MTEIHCMQGRLLPPIDGRIQAFPATGWRRELDLARAAGIDGIEWIYEEYGKDENPLASDDGLRELARLAAESGVVVESLCADVFLDRPLLHSPAEERVARVGWIARRAQVGGMQRVVLPFVDASSLRAGGVDDVVALLDDVLPELEVELHLETDLPPDDFATLLTRLDHPLVKVNYDTGNSASLGYDPNEEFAAYGARVGSVHVKDRLHRGGTVPLGEGDVDLELVFARLRDAHWERPFVLQVARGLDGAEVETVRADAKYVRALWARTGSRAWT